MTLAHAFRLSLALLLAAALPAAAETAGEPTEQQVRAALVFNFLKFTEWPAARDQDAARLRLCAATEAKQAEALRALHGRQVRNRTIAVQAYARPVDCDVIFADSRQRWMAIAENRPLGHVLTISGYSGFARDGGMIEISLEEGSPRFDINLFEARRGELRFYPQLLRLARRVYSNE